jgi:hypothetical protein
MNPAALPVLESVDTEWDRISAGKGAAECLSENILNLLNRL